MQPCEQQDNIQKLLSSQAKTEATLEYYAKTYEAFLKRIEEHIHEGEKTGGVRDRLATAEHNLESIRTEVSAIKQGYWKVGLGSGIVGALIGHLTPSAIVALVKFITGV